ncbi:putative monoamine oxidase [Streptococcus oralis]|uniref:Putative monoamine oxidase n=1 Tax=Streptococcus oralis TaxID=1303 RepID=A0A139P4W3_STROR|nr:FAD-dependent oxidoreductase [Streptococcus oralis]KXT83192.1 putative monoamine oxidase [Streptococcus oralis]
MKSIIIGAGLSGLYMAYRLQEAGKDYLILEAKDQAGGRASGLETGNQRELELGATWFWPDFDKELASLVADLQLETFDQKTGTYLYEKSIHDIRSFERAFSDGRRISGGMSQLIKALLAVLDPKKIHYQEAARSVRLESDHVTVKTDEHEWTGNQVFLALPPRLAAKTIEFHPSLPENLMANWLGTASWMAPHAKYLAQFSRAFWFDKGLTGNAMSHLGPLTEIHDISDSNEENASLFGFFGIPAQERQALGEEQLKKLARAQLVRLLGLETLQYLEKESIKDWSVDPYLATETDQDFSLSHPHPATARIPGEWNDFLVGIASEFAPTTPGFLSGAIEAVNQALTIEK